MAIKMRSREERQKALRERIKNNAKNRNSKGGGVSKSILNLDDYSDISFYKPEEGRKSIDILPWIVQTNQHPQGIEPGEEDYILDIWVHYRVGVTNKTIVCPLRNYGNPCPICDEANTIREDDNADTNILATLYPKRRALYNIIDLNDEDKGVQIFDVSYKLFEKEMLEEAETRDGEIITFADIELGNSVKFRVAKASVVLPGQSKPIKFMEFKSFSFVDRDPYDEDILDKVYPLDKMLTIHSYDEIKKIFHGIEIEEEEKTAPEKPKEKSPERAKPTVKKVDPPFEPDEKSNEVDDLDVMNKRQLRQVIRRESLGIKVGLNMSEGEIKLAIRNARSGKSEKPKKAKIECPHGWHFGMACDTDDKCTDCNVYEACADEQDRINNQ